MIEFIYCAYPSFVLNLIDWTAIKMQLHFMYDISYLLNILSMGSIKKHLTMHVVCSIYVYFKMSLLFIYTLCYSVMPTGIKIHVDLYVVYCKDLYVFADVALTTAMKFWHLSRFLFLYRIFFYIRTHEVAYNFGQPATCFYIRIFKHILISEHFILEYKVQWYIYYHTDFCRIFYTCAYLGIFYTDYLYMYVYRRFFCVCKKFCTPCMKNFAELRFFLFPW